MSKERGFYNMDFTGIIVGLSIVALIFGFLLYPTLGWLWGFLKPLIHEVTR